MNKILVVLISIFLFSFESEIPKNIEYNLKSSYYADYFNGRRAADGSIFYNSKLTSACNLFPLGTQIEVINLDNNKSIIVKNTDRINNRYTNKRIDLSKLAFSKIGDLRKGLLNVKIRKYSKIEKDTFTIIKKDTINE